MVHRKILLMVNSCTKKVLLSVIIIAALVIVYSIHIGKG